MAPVKIILWSKKDEKKLDLDAKAMCWDLKWQNRGFTCPELLLWMAEAAGCDITQAKEEAEKLCKDNKRSKVHEKIKVLIPWEMIEQCCLLKRIMKRRSWSYFGTS